MLYLKAFLLCLFVTHVSCKTTPHRAEEDDEESTGFVRKHKSPFTANLVKSVDKAIAENFEENILTSWIRSDDGQRAVGSAADMLTSYVNRNFGAPDDDDDSDDITMNSLLRDFFKSQQTKKVKKVRSQKKRRNVRPETA